MAADVTLGHWSTPKCGQSVEEDMWIRHECERGTNTRTSRERERTVRVEGWRGMEEGRSERRREGRKGRKEGRREAGGKLERKARRSGGGMDEERQGGTEEGREVETVRWREGGRDEWKKGGRKRGNEES